MQLIASPEASDWLAERGYDPQFGARPLQRVIQTKVQNPLAEALLAGRFGDGDVVELRCGPDEDHLIFGIDAAPEDGAARGALSEEPNDVAGSA